MATEHVPTPENRKAVEAMAGYGIPEEDIGRAIGLGDKALRKHYRDELDLGHVTANTAVAQNLFKIATGTGREAVTAAIFWLKCRAGWSEFSPVPAIRPQPPGKKEMTQTEAENAQQDTGWANLIH